MSDFTVQIVNGDEVVRALMAAGIAPDTVLRAAVEAAADVVEAAAEGNSPGSGDIRQQFIGKKKHEATVHVGPDKRKWYYRFFETGRGAYRVPRGSVKKSSKAGDAFTRIKHKKTKKNALWAGVGRPFNSASIPSSGARPFLRPAIDENGEQAAAAAGMIWKRALELEANG